MISFDDARTALSDLGMNLKISEVERLMSRWDEDGDGTLDYGEVARRLMPPDYIPVKKSQSLQDVLESTRIHAETRGLFSTQNDEFKTGIHHAKQEEISKLRRWKSVEDLEKELQMKIYRRTGAGKNGFHLMFRHFDRDGSGSIE